MEAYLRKNYGVGQAEQEEALAAKHKRKRDKHDRHARAGGLRVVDVDAPLAVPSGTGDLDAASRRPLGFEIKDANELIRNAEREQGGRPAAAPRERDTPAGTWVSLSHGDDAAAAGREGRDGPSPPRRRQRHDSPGQAARESPDPSPPRRGRRDSPDPSPPRRGRRDSPDPSPPRRGRRDSPDPSPPRRGRRDSPDPSPPRRGRRDSPDPSPPRRGRRDSPDPSPPRRAPAGAGQLPAGRTPAPPPPPPPPAAAAGARTFSAPGLHTDVQSEVAALQAERAAKLRAADQGELGAGAETVYRDKHGRKLDYLAEVMNGQEGGGRGGKEAAAPAWGGGLRQQEEAAERRRHVQREAAKPFARYADDEDLDARTRHTERWGDPLAGRVGADKARAAAAALRPKYRGPAPAPNRFGLQPGHRWDGVDRSNGYEREFFKMQTNASLRTEEAYKWSVEDM